jgi:hypothetical protein
VAFAVEIMLSIRELQNEWDVHEHKDSSEFDDVSAIHDVCRMVCSIIGILDEYGNRRSL